jgi:hypothetical protein
MPIRDHWRGVGGGDGNRRDRDPRDAGRRTGPEARSFGEDPVFEAEDRRLEAELRRHERERGRTRSPEYGHDQNYRPGYHEGGTRFGFFGLEPDRGEGHGGDREGELRAQGRTRGAGPYRAPGDHAFQPDIDQDFDPDYLHWRAQQMQRHDRDYADWRRHQHEQYDAEYRRFRAERRDDFHQRFQDWRAQRDAQKEAEANPPAAEPAPDDKI